MKTQKKRVPKRKPAAQINRSTKEDVGRKLRTENIRDSRRAPKRSSKRDLKASATVALSPSGDVRIPEELFRAEGLKASSFLTVQVVAKGLLLVPMDDLVEEYTPKRKAEFLLNNAVD